MIGIHEELCTVVFSTVSAYSVWFVLHWFTYGAGVIATIIYISEESVTTTKYHTGVIEFVFLGLILVFTLYLFIFPCVCAARITSNCAGKIVVFDVYLGYFNFQFVHQEVLSVTTTERRELIPVK